MLGVCPLRIPPLYLEAALLPDQHALWRWRFSFPATRCHFAFMLQLSDVVFTRPVFSPGSRIDHATHYINY